MKKWRVILILVLVLSAALMILSHIPRHLECTLTVATAEGKTAELEMDIRYYSNLILPDYVKGTVQLDGVTYTDLYTRRETLPGASSNQLLPTEWWRYDVCNMSFVREDITDLEGTFTNRIDFMGMDCGSGLDKCCFIYWGEENQTDGHTTGELYFGPAESEAQARELAVYYGYYAMGNE